MPHSAPQEMSRTIGYNPDPTLNARRDPKGPFRIDVRVMEAMLAIVGHSRVSDQLRLFDPGP